MSDISNVLVKPELIKMLEDSRNLFQSFFAGLSDAEKSVQGTLTQWSLKDELAHIAFWQKCQIERFDALQNGLPIPAFEDFQTLNEQNFETYKDQPWAEIEKMVFQSLEKLIAATQRLTEEQLTAPNPNRPEDHMYNSLIGNGYAHVVEHLSRVYVAKNKMALATELQERAANELSHFGGERGRGVALYNLACFYALTGNKFKALETIPTALKLAPDLIEWSKQDTDLDSLRGEPAFQAIYSA